MVRIFLVRDRGRPGGRQVLQPSGWPRQQQVVSVHQPSAQGSRTNSGPARHRVLQAPPVTWHLLPNLLFWAILRGAGQKGTAVASQPASYALLYQRFGSLIYLLSLRPQ